MPEQTVTFRVWGSNAREVDNEALRVLSDFYGPATCSYSLDVRPLDQRMDGRIVTWEGEVNATGMVD